MKQAWRYMRTSVQFDYAVHSIGMLLGMLSVAMLLVALFAPVQ